MKPAVFIHTNRKQLFAANVAGYALRKNSAHAAEFDVRFIVLEDQPALHGRDGRPYLREGRTAVWKNEDLQSFTPLRFLPPQLMGYAGRAVVMDPDVFALTDIWELLGRDMQGKAVVCRRIEPVDGRRPYYGTSVMLMDCAKLRHWRWEAAVEEMFAMKRDYRDWVSLYLEPEGNVGLLEEEWNSFDKLTPATKMLHNTGRLTQPWKTGLPIDFTPKHAAKPLPKKWGIVPGAWAAAAKAVLKGKAPQPTAGRYLPHPDPKQEALFFGLLKECLERGVVTERQLREEMRSNRIRKDALTILERTTCTVS